VTRKNDDDTVETLVGISFSDMYRAQEFLTAATRLGANKRLALKDAVIVVKNENGNTVVRETVDPQPARSAVSGAVWTGLLGLLLGGPVGWIAGTAVGAGAGAVTAKLMDYGIPDEWVAWFRDAVLPGTATVALLVTDLDRNALITEVERFQGAHLVYANLDDVTLDRIRRALGEAVLGDVGLPAPAAGGAVPTEPPTTETPATSPPTDLGAPPEG
jgi:uncharacterized membrane protein